MIDDPVCYVHCTMGGTRLWRAHWPEHTPQTHNLVLCNKRLDHGIYRDACIMEVPKCRPNSKDEK